MSLQDGCLNILDFVILFFLINWVGPPPQDQTLTQHCADLIGQDRVGVVQPASSTQALFEAVEDGLVGEQHHQDPQSCCDGARVKVFLHEHQEPIKAQRPHQLLARPAGGHGEQT